VNHSGTIPRPPAHERTRPAGGSPLDPFFAPRTVAVIGASERPGSVGRALLENLRGFPGRVFAVNPQRASVLGAPAFPHVSAIPEPVDLAVIATPAPTIPGLVRECVAAGIPAAVIISAGFRECGPAGADLESRVLAEARRGALRLIGPNCLGVMAPHTGLNATFAATSARPGRVAFISQSGALCTAILDWSLQENVGFSAFVSVGSMLDVGWGDLIDYLGDDPHTSSIVIYMESIGDARAFLSAAREVALTKPIIVVKVGRTEAAARAAASHTGALTGSDEVLDAAFRRVGVLRVETIEDLFDMAEALAMQPRPRGPRLAIVTNAGGPGALAADALVAAGGALAPLSPASLVELDRLLPAHWSHGNPIDVLGDADPERFARAVQIAAREPASDGVLAILTPQAMTNATATAERLLASALPDRGKPLLASWLGGATVGPGETALSQAGVPTFRYPDRAARTFASMWRYSSNLDALYETPAASAPSSASGEPEARAAQIIAGVRQAGRTLLTEHESKQILAAYDIPVVETLVALSEDAAVAAAGQLGFPVAVKLHSETITHKTEVNGVQLDVRDAAQVRRAWLAIEQGVRAKAGAGHFLGVTVQRMIPPAGCELILGSSLDPQFGPVLLFGAGGALVEILRDRALGLPPLNSTLARRLMEQTQVHAVLKGVRGRKPVDLPALEQILVRFSQLVAEQRWISEIDINPLLASPGRLLALDARVILQPLGVREEALPKLAIRPYPTQYVMRRIQPDGTPVVIRPIRPEDEPALANFLRRLPDHRTCIRPIEALRPMGRIAHEQLARLCFVDYDRQISLVVAGQQGSTGEGPILGFGRLGKRRDTSTADLAAEVLERWHPGGLGPQLLMALVAIGRSEHLSRLVASLRPDDPELVAAFGAAGFGITRAADAPECRAELAL
jgi:acetyltransferase